MVTAAKTKDKPEKIKDKFKKHNDKHYKKRIFNMPEYQKCPVCKKKGRKYRRTLGGAYYLCPEHGGFFVNQKEGKIKEKEII